MSNNCALSRPLTFGRCASLLLRWLPILALGLSGVPAFATIAYVQGAYQNPDEAVTVSTTYSAAQTAGNLNVLFVGYNVSTNIQSISDTQGNVYIPAVGPTTSPDHASQVIFYAKNIASAAAGGNTVTVTFKNSIAYPNVRIVEYSGLDTAYPFDVGVGANGSGVTQNSGSLTTNNANELLVASNYIADFTTGTDTSYTQRLMSSGGEVLEDRIVSAVGSYSATSTQGTDDWWIMQVAAFRASGSSGSGDSQAPTAPSSLSGTSPSGNLVNLSWSASSDNVGVTGYLIERCQGSSCTSFAQVGTSLGTSFGDSSVTGSTQYRYRVRATDAAGNLGNYSNIFTVGTSSIAYIQGASQNPYSATTIDLTLASAQTAGDLNVLVIGWGPTTASVQSIQDISGNTYQAAVSTLFPDSSARQVIYYAKNIAAAAAGSNVVTITFTAAVSYPSARVIEYGGIDPSNPVDVAIGSSGNSTSTDSGSITTTNANDLLVGANYPSGYTSGPGSGYTARIMTDGGDILEDQIVTSTGSYSATAAQDPSGMWIMQMVAFRAVNSSGGGGSPPGAAQYVYDPAGRLVQVIGSNGASARYTYDGVGNLLAITPLSATTAAVTGFSRFTGATGSTITIYGSGFSTTPGNNSVSFNGTAATVVSATTNALTVQVPTGASTGLVSVSDSNGTAVSSTNFTVAGSANAPTITGFTPQLADWGASVTISGTGFSTTAASNRVSFAGQLAAITSASASSLVATVPNNASSGRIAVTTNAGTAVSTQDFFVPSLGTASDIASTTRLTVGGGASTLGVPTAGKTALAIFDGSAGQIVSIAVSAQTFSSACSAGTLDLQGPGPDRVFLWTQSFCTGHSSVSLPVTGTYTLIARPVPTDTGSLTLSVSAVPSSSGTIQIGGGPVTVTTSSATQPSQLSFSSTQATQVVSIGVTGATYPSGCSQQTLKVLGPAPANPLVYTGNLCGTQSAVLGAVGTYTLQIIPFGTDTGSVTISLSSVSPVTNTLVIDGAPVTVTASTAGQQAVLTFTTTTANKGVTVQPSSDSFPSSCTEQSVRIAGPGTSTKVLFTQNLCTTRAILLPTAGTYTLTVIPTSTDTGSVTLQLASAPLVSSAVTIGGPPVTLTTTIPAQQAQFSFTTTSNNQFISVQPSACTLSDCAEAALLVSGPPPANNYIETIYVSEAAELVPAPQAGTYTLTLIPYDTDSGSITVKLQSAPPVTAGITIDGSPVTLTTTVPAQRAQWTFSTTSADQRISVQRSAATYPDGCSAGTLDLSAVAPNSPTLTSFGTCPGSWAVRYAISAPGSYVLTFKPSTSHLDVGSLTVRLQNAPDVTGTLSLNGSAQTVSTTIPAQQAVISFTSTATNQAVRLLVSGSTYPSDCSTSSGFVFIEGPAPNYGVIGSANLCTGTTSATLGNIGTYHLRLAPYNTDTGSITLQVLSP